jgi:hypothetical protein
MYVVEPIPDSDKLFYRIHPKWLDNGEIIPGAFREINDGMSTAWSKYSTAKNLQDRAKVLVGIVSLSVGGIRAIDGLVVVHDPLFDETDGVDDRAHSLVKGIPKDKKLKARVRDMLLDLSFWEIKVA